MAELTVARLREMLGRANNRADRAERQVRDLNVENTKLRREIAELRSLKG